MNHENPDLHNQNKSYVVAQSSVVTFGEREREREIPGISNRQAAVKLGGKICGSAPQRWRREREREGPRIAIAAWCMHCCNGDLQVWKLRSSSSRSGSGSGSGQRGCCCCCCFGGFDGGEKNIKHCS